MDNILIDSVDIIVLLILRKRIYQLHLECLLKNLKRIKNKIATF